MSLCFQCLAFALLLYQASTARCAHLLNIKSVSVEDSVNELIDLLCGVPAPAEEPSAADEGAAEGEEAAGESEGRTTDTGPVPAPGAGAPHIEQKTFTLVQYTEQ